MDKKSKIAISVAIGVLTAFFVLVLALGLSCTPEETATPDEVVATPGHQETETTVPRAEQIVLSFIGDCTMASNQGKVEQGNFMWHAQQKSHDYFFEGVYDVLSQDDVTFANCETVLSDGNLKQKVKDHNPAFWFKAPASYADILKLGSVEVAGVANNHTYDYGEQGCKDTLKALEAQGILGGDDYVPVYTEVKGTKIGIVFCSLWGSYQTDEIETALKEMENNCDYSIVYFHGGSEGTHYPDNYIIDACRYLANSGLCDLIVGAHPHVLQPMEIVNDVPIMYSLGNFCFGGNSYPENKTAIFQATLTMQDGKIVTDTSFIPCYVYTGPRNNYQPMVITDADDKAEILSMLSEKVEKRASKPKTTATETTAKETVANTEAKPPVPQSTKPPQQDNTPTEAPATQPAQTEAVVATQ
ncbi:MAG: CapA family protein [Clostridia bacterium]|nr:CapA family protein [Clostridia bacterium]